MLIHSGTRDTSKFFDRNFADLTVANSQWKWWHKWWPCSVSQWTTFDVNTPVWGLTPAFNPLNWNAILIWTSWGMFTVVVPGSTGCHFLERCPDSGLWCLLFSGLSGQTWAAETISLRCPVSPEMFKRRETQNDRCQRKSWKSVKASLVLRSLRWDVVPPPFSHFCRFFTYGSWLPWPPNATHIFVPRLQTQPT